MRDYFKYVEWVFMADVWFSLVYGSGLTHHIIYQRIRPPKKFWEKLFTSEDFFMYHVWYGMLVREHCHAFSRKCKAMAAFSVVCVGSFFVMVQIGTTMVSPEDPLDVGHFDGQKAVATGWIALAFSIMVTWPLIYLQRYCFNRWFGLQ